NNGNQGIAHALNKGARKAIALGYKWLLTMDQDSKASPSMLASMLRCYQNHSLENIGIISPYHANCFFPISKNPKRCNEVLVTMTSGNLLNLNVFKLVGPFMESLFIDHVDTEYCLRLWDRGYRILQVNHAVLDHKVGQLKLHKLGNKTFFSTNHSPVRKYYVYRNGSLVLDLYQAKFPEYCKKLRARYWVDAFIVLFYEKQKLEKFKMMFKGYLDYKRGIFGKYHD
ncbi:MAG: glycosyltransferase family 2 protein, partial [Campylobacterales bacterium]|nr:glycosyltransferase family 2 protein [Campylobacterales bacterium]